MTTLVLPATVGSLCLLLLLMMYGVPVCRYGELKYGLAMNVIHLPGNHPDRIAAVQRYESLQVRWPLKRASTHADAQCQGILCTLCTEALYHVCLMS